MEARSSGSPALGVYGQPFSRTHAVAASNGAGSGRNVGSPIPRSMSPGRFRAAMARISDGSMAASRGFTRGRSG
jgi:hypothetical protein